MTHKDFVKKNETSLRIGCFLRKQTSFFESAYTSNPRNHEADLSLSNRFCAKQKRTRHIARPFIENHAVFYLRNSNASTHCEKSASPFPFARNARRRCSLIRLVSGCVSPTEAIMLRYASDSQSNAMDSSPLL